MKKNFIHYIFGLTICFTVLSSANVFAATPVASYPFDGDYGDASPITREMYYDDNALIVSDGSSFTYGGGMSGQCLHTDGTESLKLNINMNTESYSVSYWIKPDKITDCTPTLMITPYGFQAEKFINLTLNVNNISPNIWSHMIEPYDERNDTGMPGLLSTDEWSHITMVVDENMSSETLKMHGIDLDEYNTGVSLYINGFLIAVGKVPKSLCIDGTGYWFGVNIWDDTYTGYVDELYFYDTALTPDEVKKIYLDAGGDPDADIPSGNTKPHDGQWWERPNGGSFSDDYIELEQGTVSGSYNHLSLDNAAPVTTQGVEGKTNAYADLALLAGIGFALLALGMFLHYIKLKKNSYS